MDWKQLVQFALQGNKPWTDGTDPIVGREKWGTFRLTPVYIE